MQSKLLSRSLLLGLAVMAHSVNRAYCTSLGDDSVPAWPDTSESHKKSIAAGVKMHIDNPDTTPEQAHQSWLAAKIADGWVYGEAKDVDAKVHPCIRPYDELPAEQRVKDSLFRDVVHAALPALLDIQEAAKELARQEMAENLRDFAGDMPLDLVRITYVHKTRSPWTDHITGSGKVFETGRNYVVPSGMATQLLRLSGMFERTKADEGQELEPVTQQELKDAQQLQQTQSQEAKEREQALHDNADLKIRIGTMDADALRSYAFTNFQQRFPANMKEDTMRQRVIQSIDQFGVA